MNKINVLICNYNYGRFIKDAIDSCFTQTRKPDLITVIDDNSIDGSQELILKMLGNPIPQINNGLSIYQSIINEISFIFVPLNQTRGPSFARNIGIDLTKDYIDLYQILDADDIMYNDKLEVLEKKMMEGPEIGVVYADYDILNCETNNLIKEWKYPFSRQHLLSECIVHSGSLIKKEALISVRDQHGYYHIGMRTGEDYFLWIKISRKYIISHVPQSLTKVRIHSNNSTNTVPKEIWNNNWQIIYQNIKEYG